MTRFADISEGSRENGINGPARSTITKVAVQAYKSDIDIDKVNTSLLPLSTQLPLAASRKSSSLVPLQPSMSFKHRHKASDAEELLKGFAPANSNTDSMERAESASLLSPTSQSSATTVMRKGVTTPRKAAAPPDGKSEGG